MRTSVTAFQIARPRSLNEALTMLRDDALMPIAGCTDVYVQLEFGQTPAQRYMDIWNLRELRTIAVNGDALVLGQYQRVAPRHFDGRADFDPHLLGTDHVGNYMPLFVMDRILFIHEPGFDSVPDGRMRNRLHFQLATLARKQND